MLHSLLSKALENKFLAKLHEYLHYYPEKVMSLLPDKIERLIPSRPADTRVLHPQNIPFTQLLQLLDRRIIKFILAKTLSIYARKIPHDLKLINSTETPSHLPHGAQSPKICSLSRVVFEISMFAELASPFFHATFPHREIFWYFPPMGKITHLCGKQSLEMPDLRKSSY